MVIRLKLSPGACMASVQQSMVHIPSCSITAKMIHCRLVHLLSMAMADIYNILCIIIMLSLITIMYRVYA